MLSFVHPAPDDCTRAELLLVAANGENNDEIDLLYPDGDSISLVDDFLCDDFGERTSREEERVSLVGVEMVREGDELRMFFLSACEL
jgi:hypothetical protein